MSVKTIKASGGAVRDASGTKLLMIFRLGKWDLPKGKLEKGENDEEAAVREVEEECGLKNLSIVRFLCETIHFYELKGVKIEKKTRWFEMRCDDHSALVPQLEENITEVRWMNDAEVSEALGKSYDNIREVVASLRKKL